MASKMKYTGVESVSMKDFAGMAQDVEFGEFRDLGSQAKMSFVTFKRNGGLKKLAIKAPKLYSPFGASVYQDDWENGKPKLSLTLDTSQTGVETFITELDALKEKLIDKLMEDPVWKKAMGVKKKDTRPVVSSKISDLYRESDGTRDDGTPYHSTLFLKVGKDYKKDGQWKLTIKDNARTEYETDTEGLRTTLVKGTQMRVIFLLESVWVVSGKCGFTFKVEHVMVYPRKQAVVEADFSDDEGEEEEASTQVPASFDDEEFDEDE